MKGIDKGLLIVEFVGLKSKIYSCKKKKKKKKKDGDRDKRAKAINESVIKNMMKHENCKKINYEKKQMRHQIKTIQSKSHPSET